MSYFWLKFFFVFLEMCIFVYIDNILYTRFGFYEVLGLGVEILVCKIEFWKLFKIVFFKKFFLVYFDYIIL